jgi:hypothetical protein
VNKTSDQGHNCWNCGGPSIPFVGSKDICPKCSVTWYPFNQNVTPLSARIPWKGRVIDAVDFSDPMAPSSPA